MGLYEEAFCKEYFVFAKRLIIEMTAKSHSIKLDPKKFVSDKLSASDLELAFAGPVTHLRTSNSFPVLEVHQTCGNGISHIFGLYVNGDKLVSVGAGGDMCPIAPWIVPVDAKVATVSLFYKKIKIAAPESLADFIVEQNGETLVRFVVPVLKLDAASQELVASGKQVELRRPALAKVKRAKTQAVPQDIQDLVGASAFLAAAVTPGKDEKKEKDKKAASKDAKHLLK
jgi:hypothetical protein